MDNFFQSIIVFFNNLSSDICSLFITQDITQDIPSSESIYHEISYSNNLEDSFPILKWAIDDE